MFRLSTLLLFIALLCVQLALVKLGGALILFFSLPPVCIWAWIQAARQKHRERGSAAAILAAATLIVWVSPVNPIVNVFVFHHVAKSELRSMRTRLQASPVTGQDLTWLLKTYGTPDGIRTREGCVEYVYEPGPWYVYQLDFIVFTLRDGFVEEWHVNYF